MISLEAAFAQKSALAEWKSLTYSCEIHPNYKRHNVLHGCGQWLRGLRATSGSQPTAKQGEETPPGACYTTSHLLLCIIWKKIVQVAAHGWKCCACTARVFTLNTTKAHVSSDTSGNTARVFTLTCQLCCVQRHRNRYVALVNVCGKSGQLSSVVSTLCSSMICTPQKPLHNNTNNLLGQACLWNRESMCSQQTLGCCAVTSIGTTVQGTCQIQNKRQG